MHEIEHPYVSARRLHVAEIDGHAFLVVRKLRREKHRRRCKSAEGLSIAGNPSQFRFSGAFSFKIEKRARIGDCKERSPSAPVVLHAIGKTDRIAFSLQCLWIDTLCAKIAVSRVQ